MNINYTYATLTQLRKGFWQHHPQYKQISKAMQNDYPANTRIAWVDFIDYLQKDNQISEHLAQRATL